MTAERCNNLWVTGGSKVRQDAVNLLKKRMGEMGKGRLHGANMKETTFEELATIIEDDYLANRRPSTVRMKTSFKALRNFFGHALARDITLDRLNAYVAGRLKDGITPGSIRNDLAVRHKAFRLAQRAGKAICPEFPAIQVSNARKGFFEEAQFRAVCKQLPTELQPIFTVACHTGWRVQNEILPLEWRHIDFEAGTLRLEPEETKNQESRVFPFAALPELHAVLKQQRQQTEALQAEKQCIIPFIFHRNGRRIKDFRKSWKLACTAPASQVGFRTISAEPPCEIWSALGCLGLSQ